MPRLDVLLHDIIRINRMRILFMKRQLADYPLCGTMHILLTYLHNHPGASQDDLAAFYALDKTTVAREAKRLEELGVVAVKPRVPAGDEFGCLPGDEGQAVQHAAVRAPLAERLR